MADKVKVLVVDDEADFRQLMMFWLQSKGYDVIVACDKLEFEGDRMELDELLEKLGLPVN